MYKKSDNYPSEGDSPSLPICAHTLFPMSSVRLELKHSEPLSKGRIGLVYTVPRATSHGERSYEAKLKGSAANKAYYRVFVFQKLYSTLCFI